MYSSTLSLTLALDEGGWSTPRTGRFTPGKETRYPLYRRLGGPQGRSGRVRKISPTPGFDPRTVQPVASNYTDYAIPAHLRFMAVILYSTPKLREVSQITSAKGQRNLRNLMMQGKSKSDLEIHTTRSLHTSERNYKVRKHFHKFLWNPHFCPQTEAIRKKIGRCWFKCFKTEYLEVTILVQRP
jgi:hypothetical protein